MQARMIALFFVAFLAQGCGYTYDVSVKEGLDVKEQDHEVNGLTITTMEEVAGTDFVEIQVRVGGASLFKMNNAPERLQEKVNAWLAAFPEKHVTRIECKFYTMRLYYRED